MDIPLWRYVSTRSFPTVLGRNPFIHLGIGAGALHATGIRFMRQRLLLSFSSPNNGKMVSRLFIPVQKQLVWVLMAGIVNLGSQSVGQSKKISLVGGLNDSFDWAILVYNLDRAAKSLIRLVIFGLAVCFLKAKGESKGLKFPKLWGAKKVCLLA